MAISDDSTVYGGLDNQTDPEVKNGVVAIGSNGTIKWIFEAIGQIGREIAIDDLGTVYFASSLNEDDHNNLYAVNSNGSLKWGKRIAQEWMGTVISIGTDGTVFVLEKNNSLLALDINGSTI